MTNPRIPAEKPDEWPDAVVAPNKVKGTRVTAQIVNRAHGTGPDLDRETCGRVQTGKISKARRGVNCMLSALFVQVFTTSSI